MQNKRKSNPYINYIGYLFFAKSFFDLAFFYLGSFTGATLYLIL